MKNDFVKQNGGTTECRATMEVIRGEISVRVLSKSRKEEGINERNCEREEERKEQLMRNTRSVVDMEPNQVQTSAN